NWLPIGGFVRPLGEDFVKPVGEESTEKERQAFEAHQSALETEGQKVVKTKSLMEASPFQRIFFLAAGPFMNFVGAFVLLVVAGLLGRPTPISQTVVILSTANNSPAQNVGIQPGDQVLTANGKPVALLSDLDQAIKDSATRPLQLTLKRGDQTVSISVPPADVPFNSGANGVVDGVVVTDVALGSPAAAVLKEGDRIVQVDDVKVTSNDSLRNYVNAHAGSSIALTVERSGQELQLTLIPRQNPPIGQGAMGVQISAAPYDETFGLLAAGMNQVTKTIPESIFKAIPDAWADESNILGQIVNTPLMLLRGQLSAQDARPVSAVGIAQMAGQVAQQSADTGAAFPFLSFAAAISIALGITNLLPIPALDGGRIVFVLIELIRGKPMDPEREGMIHLVGLMLLLGLMVILVVNDLHNPISLGLPR
ncbi:MAG TPA: RIP metalloprotease RseP, partial [Aggregatilineales bacterium]|nr:RIP metalloprotease RseP [Aggregatilineales bacterium]